MRLLGSEYKSHNTFKSKATKDITRFPGYPGFTKATL